MADWTYEIEPHDDGLWPWKVTVRRNGQQVGWQITHTKRGARVLARRIKKNYVKHHRRLEAGAGEKGVL